MHLLDLLRLFPYVQPNLEVEALLVIIRFG